MARIASVVSNGCNPDPRVLREARWLVEVGHKVTIHAFDRREELPQNEEIDGVKIIRHRVGNTPYGGTLSTAMGLMKFRKSVANALKNYDLLHCHDADTLPLAKFSSSPIIFDMHDLHHTWIQMPNPKSILRRFVSKNMERAMLKRAKSVDAIITSSTGFVNWLESRGLSSVAVENRPTKKEVLSLPLHPTVGYFGRIRELSSFILLRDALLEIQKENRPRLLIAGDGTHASKVTALFASTPEIESEIRGPFMDSELPEMMSEISLMFALYSPDRGNILDGALPAKMFEAAAFGRPSIVNRDTPMGVICGEENLGASVQWGESKSLASTITQLLGETVELKICESRERKRFLNVIETLLKK